MDQNQRKEPVIPLQKQLELLNMQLYSASPASLKNARTASIRHSISIIQNNTEECEDRLKEVNEKHKLDMALKTQRYEDKVSQLKNDLQERTNQVENLKGHLNECRAAKQAAHEELMKTRAKYNERIMELEGCILESKVRLEELEIEKKKRSSASKKMEELENTVREKDEEIKELKLQVEELEEEINQKDEAIEKLKEEVKKVEESVQTWQDENETLKRQLAEYTEKWKNQVEHDNSANEVLKQELAKLEKESEDLKTKLADAVAKSQELKNDLKECQKDKIDVRLQLRRVEMENKKLESSLEEKSRAIKTMEERIKNFEGVDKSLTTLQSTVETLNGQLERKDKDYNDLMSIKNVLNEQKTQLTADNASLRKKLDLHNSVVQENEDLKKIIQQKDEALQQKTSQIQTLQGQNQSLKSGVDKLKETLTLLEDQLVQMENALSSQSAEVESLTSIRDMLKEENHKLRADLNKVKIDLNEAKSLKAFTERRLEMTESSLKTQSESKEMELHSALEKLSVASNRNEELSKELSELTTKVSGLEGEKLELQTNLETLKGQKERLDREISSCVKTLVDLKGENDSLKQALAETLRKAENYKKQAEAAQDTLSEMEEQRRISDIQTRTKIDQQGKLINHLTEELSKFEKKKGKGGMSILTPRRNNDKDKEFLHTPSRTAATTPLPQRYKAVLGQMNNRGNTMTPLKLEQERQDMEQLQQQRDDLKTRLLNLQMNSGLTPLTKKNPTLPAPRKEDSVLLKERSNTIAGSHGNPKASSGYPHKYRESRNEVTGKCMACFEPIYKGRPVAQCEECKYDFHLACSLTAGNTCGLSEKKAYEIEKDKSSKRAEPITNGVDDDVRGFVLVKSDSMLTAQERLLVIEDGKLKMYAHPNDRKVAKPAAMYPLNERTSVYFRVDKAEISSTSKDQVPFAMKVTFYYEDGRSSHMYMFHKNKQQKRYWVRAILKYSKIDSESGTDNTISTDYSFSSDDNNKENQLVKINEKVLVDMPQNKLYVNCVVYMPSSKVYLLGSDDGLYSVKETGGAPVKIEGPSAIYEIAILTAAKLAVFIEGSQRKLTTVFAGLLKSCAEAAQCSNPSFKTKDVPYTKDCYMLATRSDTFEDTTVAAACSAGLLLCTMERGDLIAKREFKLKHNITALLMTPQSVFFGSDTVYELDTKSYEVMEFLDGTDDAIYYVQIINESHGSYPVAILDVTRTKGADNNEPEYLICFQDIGIFVDGEGRRSRAGDVLWSQVPLAFEFRHPYLYIVHFTSVEVQKLDARSYTKVCGSPRGKGRVESHVIMPEIRFLPVNSKQSPNLAGAGAKGVVVALHEAQKVKVMELHAS